jgi:hypothetical protein
MIHSLAMRSFSTHGGEILHVRSTFSHHKIMSKGFADNDAATSVEPEHVAEDHGTRSEATKDEHPTIKSLLTEDGVDVSERPISQFCELCRKILRYINDETDLSKSIMEIQHHVNDSDLKDRLQMAVDCAFNSRRVSKKTYTNPRSLLEQSPASRAVGLGNSYFISLLRNKYLPLTSRCLTLLLQVI